MADSTITDAYERRLISKMPQRIVLGLAVAALLVVWIGGWIARNTGFGAEHWDTMLMITGTAGLTVPLWLVVWAVMARLRSTRQLKVEQRRRSRISL